MTSTAFATSPATIVADARAQLLTLTDTLWATKRPHELLDTVQQIETLKATLEGIELDVIGEIEATKAAPQDGWASTKDFVTAVSVGWKVPAARLFGWRGRCPWSFRSSRSP